MRCFSTKSAVFLHLPKNPSRQNNKESRYWILLSLISWATRSARTQVQYVFKDIVVPRIIWKMITLLSYRMQHCDVMHARELYYSVIKSCLQDYNDFTLDNDIALFELTTNAVYNNYVRPICLPEAGQTFYDSVVCFAAGWGATSSCLT